MLGIGEQQIPPEAFFGIEIRHQILAGRTLEHLAGHHKVGRQKSVEPRKNPLTFHYTGCSMGLLIMAYYNPHIPGSIIPYIA